MTDYYGTISAIGIGANLVVVSGFYLRGSIRSNDLEIANKLADELPGLVKQVGNYTYSMVKGK
jgi:hypothetical protein